MFKQYQIFEVLQNDINASINESLGISDAVSSETNRECDIPKRQFSNMSLNATVKNNGNYIGFDPEYLKMLSEMAAFFIFAHYLLYINK